MAQESFIGQFAGIRMATPFAFLSCLVSTRCHFHAPALCKKCRGPDRSRPDKTEKIGVLQQRGFISFLFVMAVAHAVTGIVSQYDLPVFAADHSRQQPLAAAWNPCGPFLANSDAHRHVRCPLAATTDKESFQGLGETIVPARSLGLRPVRIEVVRSFGVGVEAPGRVPALRVNAAELEGLVIGRFCHKRCARKSKISRALGLCAMAAGGSVD